MKNNPFGSANCVAERMRDLKDFTADQCIDALCFAPNLQASVQTALIKKLRTLRATTENCNLVGHVPASLHNAVMVDFFRIHLRIYELGKKVLSDGYMARNTGNENLSDSILDYVEEAINAKQNSLPMAVLANELERRGYEVWTTGSSDKADELFKLMQGRDPEKLDALIEAVREALNTCGLEGTIDQLRAALAAFEVAQQC